jgi:hypothetical protein
MLRGAMARLGPMSTLRDDAVATLSVSISELDGCILILEGRDDRAAAVISSAKPHVVALRDKYADGAPAPLPELAAQEMRELSDLLEKMGTESGNEHAKRDLVHESRRLNFFITSNNIMIDSDARYRFDRV